MRGCDINTAMEGNPMYRKINLSTGSFDKDNTFEVSVRGERVRCSLHRGYETGDDGILWAMNSGTALKAKYTARDIAEDERLAKQTPLVDGEVVCIEGALYAAKVHPSVVSDQVVFEPYQSHHEDEEREAATRMVGVGTPANGRFRVGHTYSMTSPCDHECTWSFQVMHRTPKRVTLRQVMHTGNLGPAFVRGVSRDSEDGESCMPLGRYSMAPVLVAK